MWEFPPRVRFVMNHGMTITSSRLMIFDCCWGGELLSEVIARRISVWDWKTGDLVMLLRFASRSLLTSPSQLLELSSTDESKLVTRDTQVAFLDEFRVVVLPLAAAIAELIVINTLVPQYDTGGLRRLVLPQRFHGKYTTIRIDHDRPLGTLNRYDPLIADPAQAVLVLDIENSRGPRFFLVVRIQALVEQTRLTGAGPCVPWDEWCGDAVVMGIPIQDDEPNVFVHGAQVVVVWAPSDQDWRVLTLDFSRRGRNFLPRLDGGNGGTEKCVLFEDERDLRFEPCDGMSIWADLNSLRDGSLFHLVSRSSLPIGSEVIC